LGNCACSPAVRVGLQMLGRVDNDDFDELLEELTTVPITLIANS
jgi:formate dehydrogenase subunit gamma